MEHKELQEKVKAAEEAVKGISDNSLKAKAFEIILNKLLGESPKSIPGLARYQTAESNFEQDVGDHLINVINSASYPLIYRLNRTLDRSLYILMISKNDYNLDGLNASQISKILSIKFRLPSSPNSVGMALLKARNYVDRRPINSVGGAAYEYRITYPGEEYIKKILEDPPAMEIPFKGRKPTSRKNRPKKIKEGLKKRVLNLKEEGFFNELKEVKDVQETLQIRGHIYTFEPVAVALLRLVKKGALRRVREVKDKKNIYKYCNP